MASPATLSAPDPREPSRRPILFTPAGPADHLGALRSQVEAGIDAVDAALAADGTSLLTCQDQSEIEQLIASHVNSRLADPDARLAAVVQIATEAEATLNPQADALARRRDALPVHDPDAARERRPWDAAGITSLLLTAAVGIIACFSGGWNVASAVHGTTGYKGALGMIPAAILGVLICGAGALLAELLHRLAARDHARFEQWIRVLVRVLVVALAAFALAFAFGFADRRMGNISALLSAAAHPTGSAWGIAYCLSLLTIETTVSVLAHVHIQHILRSRYRGTPPKNPEWASLDEQVDDIRGRIAAAATRRAEADGLRQTIRAANARIAQDAFGRWRRHRARYGI